jgi:hypothetical protein
MLFQRSTAFVAAGGNSGRNLARLQPIREAADVEGDLRIRERQLPGSRPRNSRGSLAYREGRWCSLAVVAARDRRGTGMRRLGMTSATRPTNSFSSSLLKCRRLRDGGEKYLAKPN